MASVQDKAFQIEQFIGMAGDDAAEKIMQRAHDAAGGNDVRRSSPDRYDAAYYESLKTQLWPMKADSLFWQAVHDKFTANQQRDGTVNPAFNLELRRLKEMLNDNLGANLPRGELTKQLKDFDGRGHSQTYRHDQSEHITASGLQTTTGARGGVLAEDGQALYRRAGNFSSSEVAAFGDAKDKLDSLINLVSPGGEEPGPIDGKIQGEAIGNGEGWVTKSGRGYADPTAQTQHRVPGIFVSLRDQLTSSDPNLVNLNRQNQFWDRLGEVCKSPLSGDMQTILKDALGVLPPGTENRLPADVRRELGFENSKPQKPDYERPDIRIQYELKGAPEILREAFNDKVNPAIMAEAQRNLGGIKIREYFLESDMKADFLAAEGHGDPTLKYQAMRRIGEEVASWGGDVNIEVGIGLIQAASEGGDVTAKLTLAEMMFRGTHKGFDGKDVDITKHVPHDPETAKAMIGNLKPSLVAHFNGGASNETPEMVGRLTNLLTEMYSPASRTPVHEQTVSAGMST